MADTRDNTKQAQVIDENLKRVYQDMLNEEVPDRFTSLLAQLREQDDQGDDRDLAEAQNQDETSR